MRQHSPTLAIVAAAILYGGSAWGSPLADQADLDPQVVIVDFEAIAAGTAEPITTSGITITTSAGNNIVRGQQFTQFPGVFEGQWFGPCDNCTIRIEFDAPVAQVGLGIFDPNFEGDTLIAFDAAGNELERITSSATSQFFRIDPRTGGVFSTYAGFIRPSADIKRIELSGIVGEVLGIDTIAFIAICGDGDAGPGEGCDDGNLSPGDGCNAVCEVEDDFECRRADFSLLSDEFIPGPSEDPNWQIDSSGFVVTQNRNSDPAIYSSTLPATGVGEIEVDITVAANAADDDYIGVVLGFDQGEMTANDASYLLIDWNAAADNDAIRGLAASLVTGAPSAGEFGGHQGAVRELARATNLGNTAWVLGTTYRWKVNFTETRLILSIDDQVEIDITAADVGLEAFPTGSVGFYGFSQRLVTYSLVSPRGRSLCTPVERCGNAQVDAGETCDDGNRASGDGCSRTCTTERGFVCSDTAQGSLCCSTLASTFALVGDATVAATNEVTVVPNLNNQAGAVWFRQTFDLTRGFDYGFQIYLGDDNAGADGFGFVFHRDPDGLMARGVSGGGLGASGLSPSVVVEFDTFNNGVAAGDIADDHTAVFVNENDSTDDYIVNATCLASGATGCLDVEDDRYHDVRIAWQPNAAAGPTLRVFFDNREIVTLQDDLAANYFAGDPENIFFGFTASTGGSINDHKFCPQRLVADFDLDGDGVFNSEDIDSDNDGIPDIEELSGFTTDPDIDSDGDSVPDWNDPDIINCVATSRAPTECLFGTLPGSIDRDGDGIPNHLDLDSDGDSILDVEEAGHDRIESTTGLVRCPGGVGDNGLCDDLESSPGTLNYTVVDTDGDNQRDFLDLESDGDGISDRAESGPRCDAGASDEVCANDDQDIDGVPDPGDRTPGFGSDVTGSPLPDGDRDGIPDFRDRDCAGVDSDSDGQCDLVDACPMDADNDIDGDGACADVDICPRDADNDIDGDGICGDVDNCRDIANATQLDRDGDGRGDFCDFGVSGGGCSAGGKQAASALLPVMLALGLWLVLGLWLAEVRRRRRREPLIE